MSADAAARPITAARAVPRDLTQARTRAPQSWGWVLAGLTALDAIALIAAFTIAYLVRFKTGIPLLDTPQHDLAFYSSVAFWGVPAWLGLFGLYRLYDRKHLFSGVQEYARV